MSNIKVRLKINGEQNEDVVDSRLLLVELIRYRFGLTGTHIGCLTGNCGACTVLLNGLTVKSCTVLAGQADGAEITTIEGLDEKSTIADLQDAFNRNYALQCGYCTPGMLLSAHYLLSRNPRPTKEEIRHAISGNLCRCTGYTNIVKAIIEVSETR